MPPHYSNYSAQLIVLKSHNIFLVLVCSGASSLAKVGLSWNGSFVNFFRTKPHFLHVS